MLKEDCTELTLDLFR